MRDGLIGRKKAPHPEDAANGSARRTARGQAPRPSRRTHHAHISAYELSMPQELEELDALAQAAAHHLRALDHLGEQGGDLAAPEIEAFVECLERLEDLGMRQVRVVQGRDLHAALVDEFGVAEVEPAVVDRLAV